MDDREVKKDSYAKNVKGHYFPQQTHDNYDKLWV
jgi:hypothetical protein